MNVEANEQIVVHQDALPEGNDGCGRLPCHPLIVIWIIVLLVVLVSMLGGQQLSVPLLVAFVVALCCCELCRRTNFIRDDERERRQHDPRTQLADVENRRTLLRYFIFRPPDEESAERGGLGCGAPGSKTGAEKDEVGEEGAAAGSCIVCFGDFAFGEELCRLPCLHLYHAKCIDEWLDGANHHWCPLCKADVLAAAAAIRPATDSSSNNTSTTTPINMTANQEASHGAV